MRPQVAPPGFTEVTRDTAPSPRQPDSPASSPIQGGNGETPATGREAADEAPTTDAAGRWQAPSGFTAVPSPVGTPSEPSTEESSETSAATAETDSTAPESSEPPADTRNEIENWMAQLRSSRRGTAADEGRHHGAEGRTVSVNELLRRREDD